MMENAQDSQTETRPPIRVSFYAPPIPMRDFDWCATTDDYEPGHPIGYGARRQEAVIDLMEQLEDANVLRTF